MSSTFQIGLEVLYTRLESANANRQHHHSGGHQRQRSRLGAYTIDDQNNWAVRFRVNRDFYP